MSGPKARPPSGFTDWDRVPLVLNITQVADLLGISRPTVYSMLRDGKLPGRRIDRRRLVTKRALREFLGESDDDQAAGDGNGEPASRTGPPSGS